MTQPPDATPPAPPYPLMKEKKMKYDYEGALRDNERSIAILNEVNDTYPIAAKQERDNYYRDEYGGTLAYNRNGEYESFYAGPFDNTEHQNSGD